MSRLKFAELLADIFKVSKASIRSSTLDDMDWLARRPRDSSLDVSKAKAELINKPLVIEEALRTLKDELVEGSLPAATNQLKQVATKSRDSP